MNKRTSNKLYLKENATIADDYFKIVHQNKQSANLQFPNSISALLSRSEKSIYRPHNAIRKGMECQTYITARESDEWNKTEKLLNIFNPKENDSKELKFEDNVNLNCPDSCSVHTNAEVIEKFPSKLEMERKYLWEEADWVLPAEKQSPSKRNEGKIKYHWEIIGVESQTSQTLLSGPELLKTHSNNSCKITYSWEVLGIGTQASLHELSPLTNDNEYWTGKIVTSSSEPQPSILSNAPYKKRYLLLCSTGTQSTADKGVYADLTNCTVKYSWQNLTKIYLQTDKFH